jgi:hypothetical protein
MIEQEFIMLIMNCKKYVKKAQFQKKTWLPKIPSYLRYYHVIGDETLDTEFKFDDQYKVLWIKVDDDYNSLPKKVIKAYEAIYETFQFKYMFKTDDDQILVKPKFFDILKGLITGSAPPPHYGGYIVDVKQPYLSQYNRIHPELPPYLPLYVTKYCSGRFYFLSRSAISSLINKKGEIEKEYLEDYAIGLNLDTRFKTNILSLATNNFFTDIELSDFPKLLENKNILTVK